MSDASLVALLAVGLVVLVGCALGCHRWRRDHARALWRCSDCHEEITQEQLEAMEITL